MTTDFFLDQDFELAEINHLVSNDKFAFTVDVEEWFQVGAFETTFKREDWYNLESRVRDQTIRLLDLLKTLNIKATFFTLGWVAERYPAVLSEIVASGHELACHGMDHQRLFALTRQEFAADLSKAKELIEQAGQTKILGYRAPSFSVNPNVWWVYEELAEAGFSYSSSLYPVKTDHYGSAFAPRAPFYPLKGHSLMELPLSVCDMPLRRLPASGGGYFRLLPYMVSRYLLRSSCRQSGAPGIFYMHPWEMDTGQPFVKEAPWLSRFRHYSGQKGLGRKLGRLSKDLSWAPIKEVFGPLLDSVGGRDQ